MIARHILPALKHKQVAALTFSDIGRLHRKITTAGTPIRANRVVALLSKMFSLAIRWGWRADNPAKGIERHQENKRHRYLTSDELGPLTSALADHKDKQAADIIRLLLLTGARCGEVKSARWADLDLTTGVWTKPGATAKQKTDHRVPLSGPARQLLRVLWEKAAMDAEFVFAADGNHRKDVRRFWEAVCEAAGILGARLHDLRHTYASVLASAGLSLPVIGALLGRTEASTTHGETHDRQCRCVKQMRRLRRQVCRARPIWLSRRRNVENRLYRAVSTGELPVYGWPAQLDEAGLHIELAPQDVTAIDPAIILAVKPLHGGLSTGSLGLRPSMTTRLASKGVGEFPLPDCLVLFRLAEFHSWAEIERLTGNWPSQLNRGMKLTGRRGRPQRVLDRAVALTRRRIDEGDWSISEPVSTLAQIANHQLAEEGERPISEGYVRSGG